MKRIVVILLCLTCLIVLADRRGQIMSQRSVAASGSFPAPPTSTGPGIWLDVLEQVTNGVADNTTVAICTNYGFMGGYFAEPNSPPTNRQYRAIDGGVLTALAGQTAYGMQWLTNGVDANNQCYFQSNYGTIAIRLNYSVDDLGGGLIQTGTTGPTGPGPGYAYLQLVSGTWYFDWGQPGLANRISKTSPGTFKTWMNVAYVKSNDIMQVWIAGTNWLQGSGHSTENLFPTNNFAGALTLLDRMGNTNYLVKRILMWRYALTPTEIAALDTWMTAMP